MIFLEAISNPESKKKFIEMIKKYHPDVGGDIKIAQKINNAKDRGDEAVDKLYAELIGRKGQSSSEFQKNNPDDRGYNDEEGYETFDDDKDRELQKIKSKVFKWMEEITRHGMLKALKYKLEIFDFTEDQPKGNPDNVGVLLNMELDGKKAHLDFVGETPYYDTKEKLFTAILKKYNVQEEKKHDDKPILEKIATIKKWLEQEDFSGLLRANFASCTIGIDRNDLKYPILFTVIIKRPNKDRHSEESHLSLDMLENGLFDMIEDIIKGFAKDDGEKFKYN